MFLDPVTQQRQHLLRAVGIEVAGRLVDQHELRPVHERAGDRDPLQFAAGKLARHRRAAIGKADARQHLRHPRVGRVAADAKQGQRQRDILRNA